ncbi:CPBP family intramembrane glutamic endopeptidase [Salinactinospora qingdaonensis]|uniref:CAAX prenyl protease 2/Lysostaphin resistance protein A-like domain-containing protein n=1 Tax=Salinactinospora qingdaonensis TaxID=702744 RepID=A0ABP7FYN3_9ACTN
MLGQGARRTILLVGAVVFVAAGGYLYVTDHTVVTQAQGRVSNPIWTLWLLVAVSAACVRLLPWRAPDAVLMSRVRTAIAGHDVRREMVVLLGCLAGVYPLYWMLSQLLALVDPKVAVLAYFTAKVVLLLIVPVVFVGSSGLLRRGTGGADLMELVTSVTDVWRWAGLVAFAAYFYLHFFAPWAMAVPARDRLPEDYAALLEVLLVLATAALLEEFFFRALLQTRLELLLGRWSAIVVTSLLYALASLIAAEPPAGPLLAVAMAVAVQGAAGLLYGYLWSRYRNIWVNFLFHAGVSVLAIYPELTVGGAPG